MMIEEKTAAVRQDEEDLKYLEYKKKRNQVWYAKQLKKKFSILAQSDFEKEGLTIKMTKDWPSDNIQTPSVKYHVHSKKYSSIKTAKGKSTLFISKTENKSFKCGSLFRCCCWGIY